MWKTENGEIISSKMRLIGEAIELLKESHNLEEKEKWLLLSIALRSQPTLMKYWKLIKENERQNSWAVRALKTEQGIRTIINHL